MTYDAAADAAYVYLVDSIAPGGVTQTSFPGIELDAALITVDLDADGKVHGIEFLGASRTLPLTTSSSVRRAED